MGDEPKFRTRKDVRRDYLKVAVIFIGGPLIALGSMYLIGEWAVMVLAALFTIAFLIYAFMNA